MFSWSILNGLKAKNDISFIRRPWLDPVSSRAVLQPPKDPGPYPDVAAALLRWISFPYKVYAYRGWAGLTDRRSCLLGT